MKKNKKVEQNASCRIHAWEFHPILHGTKEDGVNLTFRPMKNGMWRCFKCNKRFWGKLSKQFINPELF